MSAFAPSVISKPLFFYTLYQILSRRWPSQTLTEMVHCQDLFDSAYYLRNNPYVVKTQTDPLLHYLELGWQEMRDPHPLFSTKYYLAQNPEVGKSGLPPLVHFVLQGWQKYLNPHPLFDLKYYLAQNPEVAEAGINPLLDYLELGWREKRDPHPLFSTKYYLAQNPEVGKSGLPPLVHFVLQGWREHFNPHPLFDTSYYLSHNFDVAQAGMNPLSHYLQYGWRDGRNPHLLFNTNYYIKKYPKTLELNICPLVEYVLSGGRISSPNEWFDPEYYLSQLNAIPEKNVLLDYLETGWLHSLNPHPIFNTATYLASNPDIAQAGINPLVHYLKWGRQEERLGVGFSENYLLDCFIDTDRLAKKPLNQWIPPIKKPTHGPYRVYVNSLGNYFFSEMADLLVCGLRSIGQEVELCHQDNSSTAGDHQIIIMAPHEFFYLGQGPKFEAIPEFRTAIMINVEQPQTPQFIKTWPFLLGARIVYDISPVTVVALRKNRGKAYFLPFGFLKNYNRFNGDGPLPDHVAVRSLSSIIKAIPPRMDEPLSSRPIDLTFIGTRTRRREKFLAQNAAWLSNYRCYFHLPTVYQPLLAVQESNLSADIIAGLSRRSKIWLHIHREDIPFFDWHRMVLHGMWQKTLVLTEPCHCLPGMVAGKHYLECDPKDMPAMVHYLLHTKAGTKVAEQIRETAYQYITKQIYLGNVLKTIGF